MRVAPPIGACRERAGDGIAREGLGKPSGNRSSFVVAYHRKMGSTIDNKRSKRHFAVAS